MKTNLAKQKKKFPRFVQDALKHGRKYEQVARSKYYEIMQYKMKRNIFLREAGLVIQPLLFQSGASPDELICDNHPGLLKIKCPFNRGNYSSADPPSDHSFYLQQNKNGEILHKKDHHYYYTQVIIPKFTWLWDYRELFL